MFTFVLNAILVTSTSGVSMSLSDSNFGKLLVCQGFMAIYALIVIVLLFGLNFYHCYLMCNNETTQEQVREKYDTWGGNPYDQGCLPNTKYFFSTQPSFLFDFDADNEVQIKGNIGIYN